MRSLDVIAGVLEQQRDWARQRGIAIDGKDRTVRLEDNLFALLHDETRREYQAGAGTELEGDIPFCAQESVLDVAPRLVAVRDGAAEISL